MNDVTRGEGRLAPCADAQAGRVVSEGTEHFDRGMAIDVMEDALTALGASESRAFAAGLCAAFYMCGMLDNAEWSDFTAQISARGSWMPRLQPGR